MTEIENEHYSETVKVKMHVKQVKSWHVIHEQPCIRNTATKSNNFIKNVETTILMVTFQDTWIRVG